MMVETDADRAVKANLWRATRDEILRISTRYHCAREVGVRETERQRDVLLAAKVKGYPMGLIRSLGTLKAARDDAHTQDVLGQYGQRLGLI